MNQLAKFTLKTFDKPALGNAVENRRARLVAAIEIQKLVLAAAQKGETYMRQTKKGERAVRSWFVAQDGGFYVQCRYGARPLLLDGKNNAAFVAKLDEIAAVLTAFTAAAKSGDFDQAIAAATIRKKG